MDLLQIILNVRDFVGGGLPKRLQGSVFCVRLTLSVEEIQL